MAGKAKLRDNRERIVVESPTESQRPEKTEQEASKPQTMQAVVRVEEDFNFVHFYLACGHLITVNKNDLRNKHPEQMECWACLQG